METLAGLVTITDAMNIANWVGLVQSCDYMGNLFQNTHNRQPIGYCEGEAWVAFMSSMYHVDPTFLTLLMQKQKIYI